jgi:hypothetical protein
MMAFAALHADNIELARSLCLESLRGNQKINHKTGMLSCLLALAEIELVSENISRAARLFAYAKTQLARDSLQLMEPDAASMKRLETNIPGADLQKAHKQVSELSIDELIQE